MKKDKLFIINIVLVSLFAVSLFCPGYEVTVSQEGTSYQFVWFFIGSQGINFQTIINELTVGFIIFALLFKNKVLNIIGAANGVYLMIYGFILDIYVINETAHLGYTELIVIICLEWIFKLSILVLSVVSFVLAIRKKSVEKVKAGKNEQELENNTLVKEEKKPSKFKRMMLNTKRLNSNDFCGTIKVICNISSE